MPKRNSRAPNPMETPGFAWRVALSILVFFGMVAFIVLWFLFFAGRFNGYQNAAAVMITILVGIAILVASWAAWGIRYGYRYHEEWSKQDMKKCGSKDRFYGHGSGSAVYGLGFIGALVYYVTTAPTFWAVVIGFFKALFWPGFLVYGLLKFLGM